MKLIKFKDGSKFIVKVLNDAFYEVTEGEYKGYLIHINDANLI